MAKIKIEAFEAGVPSATITIPMWFVTGLTKLFPKLAEKQLGEKISLDQRVALIKDPQANGVVLEIEDHKDNERLVISVVGNETKPAQS